MKWIKRVLIFSLPCLIVSCGGTDEPDEPHGCSNFLFSVVSASSGEDLVFGREPLADIDAWHEKIVFCVEQPNHDVDCSDTSPSLSFTIFNIETRKSLHVPLCESTTIVWKEAWLTFFDTLTYAIDYKLPSYEISKHLGDRERYLEELYINGVLQCAPCEPEHVTVFEVDI